MNVSKGEITTPKFGLKNYSANFQWEWFLLAPKGHHIQISFDEFDLEESQNCQNDYLEVREAYFKDEKLPLEGIDALYGAILARPMCGSEKPKELHSAWNMVWVHFHSDSNPATTGNGFKATFTTSGMLMRL